MKILTEKINNILPQTQCGLCGFNGCKPYAEALAEQTASINLCPPGGIDGLFKLAALTGQNASLYVEEMEKKAKPPLQAVIREAECIGCTKCITACPVDAILGSGKSMHTVIADECTGCELCIAPCPVDCIDMIPTHSLQHKAPQFKKRYESRQVRLQPTLKNNLDQNVMKKKDYIQAALARAKLKKRS